MNHSGDKRIVLDWDGTCVPLLWPDYPPLLEGAQEAIGAILTASYEVVVQTTRLAPVHMDEKTPVSGGEWAREYRYVRDTLNDSGLEDVKIWNRPWKPGGLRYVDDKGLEFDGDWTKVLRRLGL